MAEHRASFGARTDADAKLIAGLREERNGLLTQVQDMREEIIRVNDAHGRTIVERDALRAEVAALQERLRASIARGDFAQMEVAALKSQTPKHPVKVGEWVRRLVPSPACGVGTVAKVVHVNDNTSKIEYDVKRIDGQHGFWFARNCEPCDPPEATHDTEAGKAAAERAAKTEPVEIKVGDVVEVFQDSSGNTLPTDVGITGTVLKLYNDSIDGERIVLLDPESHNRQSEGGCHYAFCDVRKVTT
jgi:hypothetical protein